MLLNILQFLAGMIILYFGAEFLIKGSKTVASKCNISSIVIGMTLVALGTSLPELIVSIIANIRGEPGMAIGNVIGSNVANIGFVLGTTAILSPIYFPYAQIRYDMYFLIGITFLPLWFIFIGGLILWQGIALLLVLIIYCVFLMKNHPLEYKENNFTADKNNYLLMIQVLSGIIGLGVGVTLFVEGATGIAQALGISSLVIGMSIVALGTSLPELAASLSAIKHGETSFVIGNIIGSNIMNIVLVLGSTILFSNIPTEFADIITPGFFMLAMTVGLFFLIKWKERVTKLTGIILVLIYILFLYFNFQSI